MSLQLIEVADTRAATERGALIAAAGALLVLGATAGWRPDLLLILLRQEATPQLLPIMAFAAALPAGGELGRRAIRLSASAVRRRRHLIAWTFLAYVASITFGAAALSIGEMGPGALADPYMLVGKGLTISLVLVPWAALPLFVTAVALELWTRPPRERKRQGGPGGGPRPGTRRRPPATDVVDAGPARRAA